MTTPEPWAVGDTLPDAEHHSTKIAVLSADVESLTAVRDSVETTAIKTVFESVIDILTLVKVRMSVLPILTLAYRRQGQDEVQEDSLVELAEDCIRACNVLKRATDGMGVDDSSGPSRKQIEDIERCADPAQPSLLTITNDIRVVLRIQSVVSERADPANDARALRSGSIKECLIALRTEIWEMLRVFDVSHFQFRITAVSDIP